MPKPKLDFLIITTHGSGKRVNLKLFNKRRFPHLGLLSTPHKVPDGQLVSMTSATNNFRDGFYAIKASEADYVVLQTSLGQSARVELRDVPDLPDDRWYQFMRMQSGEYVNAVAVYQRLCTYA